jgi:uncharacterized protein (TIGR03435 family)
VDGISDYRTPPFDDPAQSTSHPAFEVAVVRRSLPIPGSAAGFRSTGGPGTGDPTRCVCGGSMWAILQAAFGVKSDRFEQLPDWTRERRFEIDARVPLARQRTTFRKCSKAF